MSDTGIGTTCAVGIFPSGDSLEGPADMAGNVWEWCTTRWQANYKHYAEKINDNDIQNDYKVVRGGTWNFNRGLTRCAYRHGYDPDYRPNYIGFRVILSPPT